MATLLVAGAITLSGCSSPQQANDTLPPTWSVTPTTSSATSAPLGPVDFPVPEAARQQTAEGAAAFIAYYVDLINVSSAALDAASLAELSTNCDLCTQIADEIAQDRAAGYSYVGGELTITSTGPPSLQGDQVRQSFTVDQTALSIVDSAGQPVPELQFPEYGSLSSGATAQWDDTRTTWTMVGLTLG